METKSFHPNYRLPGLLALVVLFLVGSGRGALAQAPSAEYQLKAVLLWRLAQYTEWPEDVLPPAPMPIVIGVLGENPFGNALELAIRDETAHGHPLRVRYYKSDEDPVGCHILFVAQSERSRVKQVLARLRDRSILTVSDMENFARGENGMVRFALEQKKVNLIVNLDAVTDARLVLDARLLRMADIVRSR